MVSGSVIQSRTGWQQLPKHFRQYQRRNPQLRQPLPILHRMLRVFRRQSLRPAVAHLRQGLDHLH